MTTHLYQKYTSLVEEKHSAHVHTRGETVLFVCLFQGLLTFISVTVNFLQEAWECLDPAHRTFCRDLLLEKYSSMDSEGENSFHAVSLALPQRF